MRSKSDGFGSIWVIFGDLGPNWAENGGKGPSQKKVQNKVQQDISSIPDYQPKGAKVMTFGPHFLCFLGSCWTWEIDVFLKENHQIDEKVVKSVTKIVENHGFGGPGGGISGFKLLCNATFQQIRIRKNNDDLQTTTKT